MEATTGIPGLEGIRVLGSQRGPQLLEEVAEGLRARPQPWLPAKLFYDARGSALFDEICRTPEYYPTRTELELLERVAGDVARRTEASELVELGSGMARKTHVLLEALQAGGREIRYVPFDVSESAVRHSAERLVAMHPGLRVLGLVGDFIHDLDATPRGDRRLVAFLGGTIGNFDGPEAEAFLSSVARMLGPDDALLLGADLVKDKAVLDAAYNDAAGVTARFNLNMLTRLQREFGAELRTDDFVHRAFFDPDSSRVEMHLVARRPTRLRLSAANIDLHLGEGASIRTEISRKFTPEALERILQASGLALDAFYRAPIGYALALARPTAGTHR